MLNLVMKDFLIQKKTLLLMLAYILVFMFAFQSLGNGAFAGIIVAVTYSLVTTACNHEEKVNSDIIFNSMPLRRRDIVLAKYLSVIAYTLLASLCYFIITKVVVAVGIKTTINAITLGSFTGAIFAILVMNGIYFPVYFKYGFIKAKTVSFILFFLFFFGVMSLLNAIEEANAAWLQPITRLLFDKPNLQASLLLIVAAAIFSVGSYVLSVKLYENRDF